MLHYIKLREDAGLRLCDVVGKVDTRRQENWLLVPAQALTACVGGGGLPVLLQKFSTSSSIRAGS